MSKYILLARWIAWISADIMVLTGLLAYIPTQICPFELKICRIMPGEIMNAVSAAARAGFVGSDVRQETHWVGRLSSTKNWCLAYSRRPTSCILLPIK